LLVLPLLVVPLMALAFYAAGGGKAGTEDGLVVARGINTALPDADFKVAGPADKMAFYEQRGKDTARLGGITAVAERMGFNAGLAEGKTAEIHAKLAALDREINSGAVVEAGAGQKRAGSGAAPKSADIGTSGSMKGDVDRLEMLMKSMKSGQGADPEMAQMNGMLEKLLDIQNPARAQQKVVERIYGQGVEKEFLAVPAELATGGKVLQGSTVKLRLLDTVVLKGVVVPKGHLVYGLCRLVNQRLLLDIKHVRLGHAIIPVELTLYGMDGMPGLAAPDAVFSDAAAGGAVDAASGISVYGMDGIAGQVAGAGVDAAKSLFRRKVKVVKVKLKAGEKVLLRNNRP
ncbi:MAG: conjugative transposon protein TraM, partial [Proteobacteria bacterium]